MSQQDGAEVPSQHVRGHGVVSPGTYRDLSVAGSGKVRGPVKLLGNLDLKGACKVEGDIRAEGDVSAQGACTFTEGFSCTSADLRGAIRAAGDVKAVALEVRGAFKCEGDVEAERVELTGAVTITGLLNAEEVRIALEQSSSVGSIGCSRVTITSRGGRTDAGSADGAASETHSQQNWIRSLTSILSTMRLGGGGGTLSVTEIEADQAYLEYTRADRVSAHRVKVGPGCLIEHLEYGELEGIHETSEVKKRSVLQE